MDQDIYELVAKYGFKGLHSRLTEIMREEYLYFQKQFEVKVQVSAQIPQVLEPVKVEEKKRAVRKEKVKKAQKASEPVASETVEIKDVFVTTQDRPGFRDPKEMKEFQKASEDKKRKENEEAGVQLFEVLTKENLSQWIENEGRTYAWVAREKAGCAETQVAATAQMMGIKSKISKRRGIIMSGH